LDSLKQFKYLGFEYFMMNQKDMVWTLDNA